MNENDGNPWSNLGKEITLVDENPKARKVDHENSAMKSMKAV
jgi:hypothetical protein